MKLYSVNDAKAGFYGNPFSARTNSEAMRNFQQAINDTNPNNLMNAHPADFSLFEIGEFDDETGQITPIAPKHLANGVDFKPAN